MSYMTTGDVTSSIGSALKSGIDFYGKSQADAAVADLARQQAAQQAGAASSSADSGLPVMPIVLLAGAGLAAWLLLRKK